VAEIQPFRALHYTSDLQDVVAPPYDVIDAAQRAELVARSPYNVVEIDLPQDPGDPYEHAAEVFRRWQDEGVLSATTSRRCGRSSRTTRARTAAGARATGSSRA